MASSHPYDDSAREVLSLPSIDSCKNQVQGSFQVVNDRKRDLDENLFIPYSLIKLMSFSGIPAVLAILPQCHFPNTHFATVFLMIM